MKMCYLGNTCDNARKYKVIQEWAMNECWLNSGLINVKRVKVWPHKKTSIKSKRNIYIGWEKVENWESHSRIQLKNPEKERDGTFKEQKALHEVI